MFRYFVPLGLIVLAACGGSVAQQSATSVAGVVTTTVASAVPPTTAPTFTPEPTATLQPTSTTLPTSTPEPSATTPPPATPTSASSLGSGAAARPTTAPTIIVAQPEGAAPTTIAAQPEGGAPTSPPPPAPTWTAAPPTDGQRFVTLPTPDGFVAVRDDPNTNSPILRSLVAGTEVVCTGVTEGESLEFNGRRSDRWYLCPEVGGFIFELLVEPANGTGAAPSAPSGPPVVQYVDGEYRVVLTPDGFVSVRTQPTTTSAAVATLTAGTVIRCTQIVKGEQLTYLELATNQWLFCPANGGYVFAPLLVTTQGAAAVVEPYIVP